MPRPSVGVAASAWLVCILLVIPAGAKSQILPAAEYVADTTYCCAVPDPTKPPISYTSNLSGIYSGQVIRSSIPIPGAGELTSTIFPNIASTSTILPAGNDGTASTSLLVYGFKIVGPSGTNALVDIDEQSSGVVSASNNIALIGDGYISYASTFFAISQDAPSVSQPNVFYGPLIGDPLFAVGRLVEQIFDYNVFDNSYEYSSSVYSAGFGTESGSLIGSGSGFVNSNSIELTLSTDTVYYVTMQAGGRILYGGSSGATVDPYISIDPTFLSSNPGYSVLVSQGISNSPLSSAAPEASTWLMLLVGLGLLGSVLRARLCWQIQSH